MSIDRAVAQLSPPGEDSLCPGDSRISDTAATFRQILRSSALMGASSLSTVLFGILRTKAMALLLGPSSFGLMGTYNSIVDLTRTFAQMGVNSSGVRQIAQSAATGDDVRTATTSLTLKRVAVATASLGALLLLAGAAPISRFTFGTAIHQGEIALLSFAVFFGVLAGGQVALIQGLRRIADLSRLTIIYTGLGTVAAIVLVYFLRERGLAVSIIVGAAVSAVAGWHYSRRIPLPRVRVSLQATSFEASALVKLGMAFMAAELLTQASSYLARIIILRDSGLAAAGLYQAAWTLGGLYIGFVLQSMATDFYPRLAGCIHDKEEANRIVNQQATMSILLAGPGVIATLTFAPVVVHVLYSSKFDGAIETLRWLCLGMALRAITWPIGFIVAATGRQFLLFAIEFAWAFVNVVLTLFFVDRMGLVGAGVAFFFSYIFHAVVLYPLVGHLTGFRWTRENILVGLTYIAACSIVVTASYTLPTLAHVAVGTVVCAFLTLQSLLRIVALSSTGTVPRPVARLIGLGRSIRRRF